MTKNYREISRMSEKKAREYLELLRWPNGPVCPSCGQVGERIVSIKANKAKKIRAGLNRCKDCRKQFTVTMGSIFERSHIPVSKWLQAIYKMCSSKKGVSALQLKRELWGENEGSYETAWFMCHRIREAMKDKGLNLSQNVEVDETFVGGKAKNMHRNKAKNAKKTAVMVLVERGKEGRAKTFPIADTTASTLRQVLTDNVLRSATIHTDDALGYSNLKDFFFGGHHVVKHSQGEYVRKIKGKMGRPKIATTNRAEGFFSLFKRGIIGNFHHVSEKHMARYAQEFAFRYSHKHITDAERAVQLILGTEGRRLTYRQPSKASA